MKQSTVLSVLLAMSIQFLLVQACFAGLHGNPPNYRHTLSVLRAASGYLEDFTPSKELNEHLIEAVTEIDAAIKAINSELIEDGKNRRERVQISSTLNKIQRYQKALALLKKVRVETGAGEDTNYANGLQLKVTTHVNNAVKIIENILVNADFYGRHPDYMKALIYLHEARGFLNKITTSLRINNNELNAIGEINAAMNNIKSASIDGGKDFGVDAVQGESLALDERYGKALVLLQKTHKIMNLEETNTYAKSPKEQSLWHINNAISIVMKGMK